ncbi:MAG TPA: hypothetical protein VK643_04740 [Burkholderiales bacterium]|nr:hypothetical protein [Burkholderiales bacterium]
MNIRIVALGLILVAQTGLAQESYKPVLKAKAAERAAMLQTLQRGKEIKGSSELYRFLPEVHAVEHTPSAETPQQALARTGEGGAQILETKGRLVLYRSAQPKPALVERVAGATVYPTVVNVRTGTLGVLTGSLVVKPKSMADAAVIANSHGVEKGKEYPHLQTVFYRVRANADIADVAAALQADPRVESAYPEIIEHLRSPK